MQNSKFNDRYAVATRLKSCDDALYREYSVAEEHRSTAVIDSLEAEWKTLAQQWEQITGESWGVV